MALEAASFLNDLVATNPVGATDTKAFGDDHIRLLKSTLKATFPLAVGARLFRDDDAGAGLTLSWDLWRKSSSPAPADLLASYDISFDSSTGVKRTGVRLLGRLDDPVNATEDTSALLQTMVAGTLTTVGTFNGSGVTFPFPLLGAGRPPTIQAITATGTYNRPADCKKILMWGCGGGGAGGGISNGGANTAGAGGGGGGGFAGLTNIIDPGADFTGDVTIGAGGFGVSGGNGLNGGVTSVLINGVTYSWPGGLGGIGGASFNSPLVIYMGRGVNGAPSNVLIGLPCTPGNRGIGHIPTAGAQLAWAGIGGSSIGGPGADMFQSGVGSQTGSTPAASSWGAGGGGGVLVGSAAPATGGGGRGGAVFFLEFY